MSRPQQRSKRDKEEDGQRIDTNVNDEGFNTIHFLWGEKSCRLSAKTQGLAFCFCAEENNTDPFKEKGMKVCMKLTSSMLISRLIFKKIISQPLDINETYASVDVFLKFQLIATHHPLTTFTDMRGESCRAVASATSL